MDVRISRSTLSGDLRVPASKSYAQRAILTAGIAQGGSLIGNLTFSADVNVAIEACRQLGADVRVFGDSCKIIPADSRPLRLALNAGESGLSGRMLTGILMCLGTDATLDGLPALRKRPFSDALEIGSQLGVSVTLTDGSLPLTVTGRATLPDQDLEVDGSVTSQFITGLLIGLPLINFSGHLVVSNPASRPYIDMTIDLLKSFGVHWLESNMNTFYLGSGSNLYGADVMVEGDWSGAAAMIACSVNAGSVGLTGLAKESLQSDRRLLEVIDNLHGWADDTIRVENGVVSQFDFDAVHCPDLFPPLAAIATCANGPCRIHGVSRLRHKESDRAAALQTEFQKLGLHIEISNDTMIIHPGDPGGAEVLSWNDHRIAMALSALALRASSPVVIRGAECVDKSYPSFFEDLGQVGGKIDEI